VIQFGIPAAEDVRPPGRAAGTPEIPRVPSTDGWHRKELGSKRLAQADGVWRESRGNPWKRGTLSCRARSFAMDAWSWCGKGRDWPGVRSGIHFGFPAVTPCLQRCALGLLCYLYSGAAPRTGRDGVCRNLCRRVAGPRLAPGWRVAPRWGAFLAGGSTMRASSTPRECILANLVDQVDEQRSVLLRFLFVPALWRRGFRRRRTGCDKGMPVGRLPMTVRGGGLSAVFSPGIRSYAYSGGRSLSTQVLDVATVSLTSVRRLFFSVTADLSPGRPEAATQIETDRIVASIHPYPDRG
jgi:hypothetical protein